MKNIFLVFSMLLVSTTLFAERKEILINNDWHFRFSHQVERTSGQRVDLPHTWNAQDALSGKQDYYRGMGNYEKKLTIKSEWKGKRVFIRFEGVNTVANLFVNDTHIGEHRGGYGAFVFELTDCVNYGAENKLTVKVSNALQLDVMPLVGDFNFYGGIYRDVNLIITDPINISLTDYASAGVYLVQEEVTKKQANVQANVLVSNAHKTAQQVEVEVNVWNGSKLELQQKKQVTVAGASTQTVQLPITIHNPHLWNGRQDPFMYRAEVILSANGSVLDRSNQPLGLRFYHIDAEQGFFLNGEHLKLHGVCRHQDRAEIGNALHPQHHDEDAAIMLEMGANAVRLAHYPQASYFYDLMDQNGLVVWAEIPFIGPGGYLDRGYNNLPAFRDNGKEQLKELIRQHYNHPSICFWGLFNELKTHGDNPIEYIQELDALAKREDPTRPTVAASFSRYDDPINQLTDIIAWNQYFGWYGGKPSDLGAWADRTHREFPQYKMGISEYGAGASVYHQQDSVKAGSASGWWHPENFQTYYHIGNWQAIAERPYIWGSFIWNLFDFGAAHRTEGDRPGINDKGLVSFDRKVRKDAFYFYKANWNQTDAFVYIANRRHMNRTEPTTDVMVFSNLSEVELWVNNVLIGKQKPDTYATFTWKSIALKSGENTVEVRSVGKKVKVADRVCWILK